MKTTIFEENGKMVAVLCGSLDTAAAIGVEKELKPLQQNEGKDIVIDCAELDYIASSGLRILLGILKKAKSTGNSVTLRAVNDDIKNVFNMTGFVNLFKFE